MNTTNFYLIGLLALSMACHSPSESDKNSTQVNFDSLGEDTTKKSSEATISLAKSKNDTTHYGLDISSYQGDLVQLLNSGNNLRFIFCKASQGITYTDPDFRTNWQTIKQKGFIRGAYHFYVCNDDPLAQANHFSSLISDIQASDIPPVLDIEQGSMAPTTNPAKMQSDILLFLKEVEKLTGRRPMVYTDYAFANQYLKVDALQQYELWLAEYSNAPEPRVPLLWKNKGYKIWQRSDSYTIDSKESDYDVYYGTLNDLVK